MTDNSNETAGTSDPNFIGEAEHSSGATASVWNTNQRPQFFHLREDISTDICIVGAGITGLTTAYLLSKTGKRVVVLERDEIASGESGRSTAHITHALDDRYFSLEQDFGRDGIRIAAESHTAAIDLIEKIVTENSLDCDFERVDGYLFAAAEHSVEVLTRELEAVRNAGLAEVTLVERVPVEFDTGPCLRFPRQAQFDPVKYLSALAEIIVERGGRIFTQSPVSDLRGGVNAFVAVENGARVHTQDIVVATNSPINDTLVMHTKQAPYRTYVVGFDIDAEIAPHILLWDTADPYHYIRTANNESRTLLIVGGEDHKCGQENDGELRFEELKRWTRERFPAAGEVVFQWSGQVLEPIDGLAYIGSNPLDASNVFIATGDSGNGITHGTLAGILLSDLLLNRENPWKSLYAPSRKTFSAAGEFVLENANVAQQYTEWVKPGEYESEANIACGSGGIIRDGIHKIATYRDDNNRLHTCNAACPHLGCVVAWNDVEKSWDCPCHGSRFDPYGRVLSGPSRVNLTVLQRQHFQ